MAAVPLSNDTALCLAASALQGSPTLTRSQRELLKAVAQVERVEDIVRHARLPERLAKRELQGLLERGLLALKDPDSVRYRERQSSGIDRDDTDDRHAEDRHSVTRLTDESEAHSPDLVETAIESPRRAAAAVARWVQVPPRVIGRALPVPTEEREEELDSEMEAAFERLRSSPHNNLGDDDGRPPQHTRVPSTLPSGTPGSVDLPGEFRLPSLPPGYKAPRPDGVTEVAKTGPGQPRSTLRSPTTSGTNPIPPEDPELSLPSRPPPRFSGIEALKPGDSVQAQPLGLAAGAEGVGNSAIPRFPSPTGHEGEDRVEAEPIPLVTVVRSPMITLGRPQPYGTAHPGSPNLDPLQILNASHNPRPGVGTNTRPGMGNPPHPGGASTPNQTIGAAAGSGRQASSGPSGAPTTPPSSEPRSGSTIEGMPAQGSSPPAQLQPVDPIRQNPLARTAIGGISAPPDPNRRPSVVVRPAGRDSIPDGASSPFDATPTGKTLLGVLAPTADQLSQTPANDSLHSSMDAKASGTSTTMPSLRAGEIRSRLSTSAASQGDQHLDHYEIIECLARGGAGVVYKVRDPHAAEGNFLALKVLLQGTHRIAENVEAFVHEARLMGSLAHPNLVELRYFGRENDEPFLLMEYVEGLSMSDLLHHPVPLPLDVGLIIIQDALQALDYVHNVQLPEIAPHGLVHCDVSPQNLLVGVDGYTRLIDFGTSRASGLVVGDAAVRCKPRYSSPELIAGEAVSAESDIFSMGAVLFQLLSKQPAFSADPTRRKRESLVPNPSMLNRRAPTPFDPICQRALDPDASSRFTSAREMLEALDSAVDISGIELRRQRINFWVKRVLQSRHGDVEFDMAELEDLLDNKRAFGARSGSPSNPPLHRGSNPPAQTRSAPPPDVVTRTPTREFAAPRDERYADSSPPSSDGQIGAASRFEQLREGESPLRLKTRLWVTGAAIGAIIAISAYALLGPPNRSAPTAYDSNAESPALPSVPPAAEPPTREELLQRSVNSLLPNSGLPAAPFSSEPVEPQAQMPPTDPEPARPTVAPVNEPEPILESEKSAQHNRDIPRAAPPPRPRGAPPRVAPPQAAPPPPAATPEPAAELAAPPAGKNVDVDPPETTESIHAARPTPPDTNEAPEPPPAAEPPPPAATRAPATPSPSYPRATPRTPRTEALPDRGRPTTPIQP